MRFMLVLTVVVGCASLARAENWPEWRGPGRQGHTSERNLPLTWSAKDNVKWKVKLPEASNSTPIIWEDKIFLTHAKKDGSTRSLLCLDRKDGRELWRKEIPFAQEERVWSPGYYASASPATDGERVVVSYGSAGMYCYDFTGKELWKRTDLGMWSHQFGNASSPILHGELAILWCGPDKTRNALLAVNKKTGETVWEKKEKSGSWSTPLIVKVNEQEQLLLGMSYKFKGFDPKTGNELWSCGGLNELVYTSALYSNGIAVAMSGYHKDAIAVRLGGSGDITKDRLWHHPKNIQRVGSGAIVGEHIYMIEEDGTPHCYELATGKEIWERKKESKARTWGSVLVSGDRLYVLFHDGSTQVLAASPKYQLLATNRLLPSERTNSSIAVSNGDLFIRTFQHLWCIAEKK